MLIFDTWWHASCTIPGWSSKRRIEMKQEKVAREKRVLVVDDEATVCKSVSRILEREDLFVDEAFSGKDALSQMERNRYSVVITDMMMPGIGGMDLIRRVKERWPETSVVMITGYATIKTAIQAIKLGAFDYIPKPFTPEELAGVTVRAIERMKLYQKEAIEAEEKKEVPPGRDLEKKGKYYIMEHSWALVEEDGTVRIGMDDIFQKTTGDIINIDLPFEGDKLEQGRICVRVTSAGLRIHKLWSPLSGKVIEVNEGLNKYPLTVNMDPYGKGWLVRIEPSKLEEELKNLVLLK
jgi:glycine cleavage system H lipoate-binding protein/ActR/RegA family two-component response regulator